MPRSLPSLSRSPFSIDDLRSMNAARGYHFFDRDTMRFFASRLASDTFDLPFVGVAFLHSDKACFNDPRRVWKVGVLTPDGNVARVRVVTGKPEANGWIPSEPIAARSKGAAITYLRRVLAHDPALVLA